MTSGGLTGQTTPRPAVQWLSRAWLAGRVVVGVSIAEAAVVWLGIEALSNGSVGSIPFGPVIIAMLLIGLVPTLPLRTSPALLRLIDLAAVVAAALLLVKSLCFPDRSWLENAWLSGAGESLTFHHGTASMPVWVPILLVVGAWWWRQRYGDYASDDVRMFLRVGAIALIILAMVGAFSGMATQGQIATAGTVFFAAILLAMSWVRQAAVHPGERSGGTGVAALTGLAAVIAILLVASALVAIANPSAFDGLLWLLAPVFWLVRMTILGLSWVLLIIAYPVFWLLDWLLSLQADTPSPPATAQPMSSAAPSVTEVAANAESLSDGVRVILAAVILAVIVLLIARQALRRVTAAALPGDVEQHVELDLRSLIRRRRRATMPAPDPLAVLRGDPRYRNTVAIREIYARFLGATADAGLGRVRPETAGHHARRVASALDAPTEDIRLLTGTYGAVRYDTAPATDEQLRAVSAAWERLAPRLTTLAAAQPGRTPGDRRRRINR